MIPENLKTQFDKEQRTFLSLEKSYLDVSEFFVFEKSESSNPESVISVIGTFPKCSSQNLAELPLTIKVHDQREKERLLNAKLDKKKIKVRFV